MLVRIFLYTDYRKFLRDYLDNLPKRGRGELGQIAKTVGVHSTFMSLVMAGDRDFSQEQAFALAGHLQLTELETDYLCLLVQHARAGNQKYKSHIFQKIEAIQKESRKISQRFEHERQLTDLERSVFYSAWIYSAIRLFCSTSEGGRSPEEVMKRFSLSRKKVLEVIEFLTSAGLLAEKEGFFKMGPQRTFLEFGSPHLTKHHGNWRLKALQRSDDLEEGEMMFTSPMSVAKKDFTKIREMLAETLKNISPIIKDSPAEEVACLNLDFFWLKA